MLLHIIITDFSPTLCSWRQFTYCVHRLAFRLFQLSNFANSSGF